MEEKKGRSSLVDSAAEALIAYILDNKLSEGMKLPNEYELAQQLNVGRNTIREAIRRLAARNILVVRQGAGTFVAAHTGIPEDPLGLTFIDDPKLALELSDVRMLIEPAAAEQAALYATDAQLQRMQEICEELRTACVTGESYVNQDLSLHRLIGECCGNTILRNLCNIIADAAAISIRITEDRHRDVAYLEHKSLVDAICRRDAAGARYAMAAHLNTARQSLAAKAHAMKLLGE